MSFSLNYKSLKFAFIALAVLISINLWSFKLIEEATFQILEMVIIIGMVFIVLCNLNVLVKKGLIFKWHVHFFIWIPLLSVAGAYIYHDQPYNLTLLLLRSNFFWLLYFVLHVFNISKEQVIKLVLFTGAVWILLTVVQQFTYPLYFFYSRDDSAQSIYRAGVYRYMIGGQKYGLFFLLFFFYRYLTTEKLINLVFVFIGLVGLYYYGTRQIAIAAFICMGLAVLLLRGNAKWKYILFFVVCVMLTVPFTDQLFGSYIEMTTSQLEFGDEDIRMIAANFYLNEYWPPGLGAKLLGNGPAHQNVAYGQEMFYITKVLLLYRSDVGIIGAYNQFGIFYVINILALNLKGVRMKFLNPDDKYLKLFFYSSLIVLLTSQGYSGQSSITFFCLTFYLIDISFKEQKENNAKRLPSILK